MKDEKDEKKDKNEELFEKVKSNPEYIEKMKEYRVGMEIDKSLITEENVLDTLIKYLANERLSKLVFKGGQNAVYDNCVKESISLSASICKLLGSEREFFNRYEELSSTREDLIARENYKQGFEDGMQLLIDIYIRRKNAKH